MDFSNFPGSCSAQVLMGFSTYPDVFAPDTRWGGKPHVYLGDNDKDLTKFRAALEAQTKLIKSRQNNSGLYFAVTADHQNKFQIHNVMIEQGWIPLIEGYNNPIHNSTCTFWVFIVKPSKLKALRMKGSSRKKIQEFVNKFVKGEADDVVQ